jgi:hypothetical protein
MCPTFPPTSFFFHKYKNNMVNKNQFINSSFIVLEHDFPFCSLLLLLSALSSCFIPAKLFLHCLPFAYFYCCLTSSGFIAAPTNAEKTRKIAEN